MTDRENFFHVMRGGKPERVPFAFHMCDSLRERFRAKYGTGDYLSYYGIPFRYAEILPSRHPVDYSPFFAGDDIDYYDHWGVGHKRGSVAHFTKMISPMRNFGSPREVWDFPMEDYPADYRWEGLPERIAKFKEQDKIVVSEGIYIDIFEPAWYLRGLENLLCDFVLAPEMAEACLDRTLGVKIQIASRFAAAGVDVLVFGDDVGTERGMMMSPETWREWLAPRLAKAISAAKASNPAVLCYYHSDGDIRPIIGDLIACGVDILNPIQPECMDPAQIYSGYKDRLAFWGTIGTQTTMPFGSPQDVTDKTNEMLKLCRDSGRLVLAPTHLLEPEVPLENVDAFVSAVKGFGGG